MVDLATRRRICIGLTTLVVLAAGACSTSQDPGGSPTSSKPVTRTSTPATTSATPSAPPATEVPFDPVPEAARQHTNEGAIAFALFFVDQMNKGYQHPQANILSRLCTSASRLCSDTQRDIDSLVRDGLRADMAIGEVRQQEIVPTTEPGLVSVGMHYYETGYRILDKNGVVKTTATARFFPIEVLLQWQGDGWLVQQIRTTTP